MTAEPTSRSPIKRAWSMRPWRRAFLFAVGAVYVPLLLMCLYTQIWVACSHCKKAVWQVAPLSPGLIVTELGRSLVHWPRPPEWVGFGIAGLVSLLVLGLLALGLRRAGRWQLAVMALTMVASTWLAMTLLSLIRA